MLSPILFVTLTPVVPSAVRVMVSVCEMAPPNVHVSVLVLKVAPGALTVVVPPPTGTRPSRVTVSVVATPVTPVEAPVICWAVANVVMLPPVDTLPLTERRAGALSEKAGI